MNNPVSVQTTKDAIVAKGVYSKYVNEIMHFAVWVCAEHAEWFTEYGKEKYDSNPYEHYIDIPFLLGLYLSCGCSFTQAQGRKLFPGSSQSQLDHVSAILKKVLKENKQEALSMGYDSVNDIGLHSIQKGVSTYLASLPGGPSPAVLCLRGGWSMGQVRDISFHQTQGCDEFTG